MIIGGDFDKSMGVWGVGAVKKAAGKVGGAVTGAGKAVGKGVATGAKAVGKGAKTVAGGIRPPWEGLRLGEKGWATRLGKRLQMWGQGPSLCSLKRFENTKYCKAIGEVGWEVGKKTVEKTFGLPDGSLTDTENILNQIGRDPKGKLAAKNALMKRGAKSQDAADLVEMVATKDEGPGWWDAILQALGLQ